jgi:hypothetical protein
MNNAVVTVPTDTAHRIPVRSARLRIFLSAALLPGLKLSRLTVSHDWSIPS